MTIENVRKLSHNSDKVVITQHAAIKLRERHIKYNDIISAIQTGEIIENYPTDLSLSKLSDTRLNAEPKSHSRCMRNR